MEKVGDEKYCANMSLGGSTLEPLQSFRVIFNVAYSIVE
jgi:hypothetical protein